MRAAASKLKMSNKQDGSTWVTGTTMMLNESSLGPAIS